MDIPGGEIRPRPASTIFVLDAHRAPGRDGHAGVQRAFAGDPLDLNDDGGGKAGWAPASRLLIEAVVEELARAQSTIRHRNY